MRNVIIALGVALMVVFAGSALAADQTKARSKDQIRSTYQTGTKDQTLMRDQQKSHTKDATQARDRVKDGSGRTTK